MSFYEEIAKYYNYIFPLNEQKLSFLENSFKGGSKLLDIACATGEYTNALNEKGFKAVGIDLDQDMINLAKDKYPTVDFKVMNMLDIRELDFYDGIYCIGNSIVHLNSELEIYNAISIMYNALKKDGVLVIQIINYDRVLNQNIDHLPTIKNEHIEFIRKYDLSDQYVNFNTTLKVNDKSYQNTVKLYPLKQEVLVNIFRGVGFKNIESYNGFTNQTFNKDSSMALVIKATK